MWWQCISFIWMCGRVWTARLCACVVTFLLLQAHSTCKRGLEKAAAGSEPTLSKTWCSAIYHTWPTHLVEGTQTKTQTKHKPKTKNTTFSKTIAPYMTYSQHLTTQKHKNNIKTDNESFYFPDVGIFHLLKTKIRNSTHQRVFLKKSFHICAHIL